ncbi:relA-associated inhibitor isoform X2 [Cololabis saira]|uniref:relA-associated inhibitor isoform X2 n=1 Tax=Cololabis saira TaxID=129043 RepID=UPI002AD44B73|nr:relA-associated inhibitor isoform X2 [Cololabis saira]
MSAHSSFGSSMLFQSINDDLNASLATADELSKEFNSLLMEASSSNDAPASQSAAPWDPPLSSGPSSLSSVSSASGVSGPTRLSGGSASTSFRPVDSAAPLRNPSPPVITTSPRSSPGLHRKGIRGPDLYPYGPRPSSPSFYDRSPPGQSPVSVAGSLDLPARSPSLQTSPNLLHPYDQGQVGRRSPRSPRMDRSPSPLALRSPSPMSFHQSGTLPRSFPRLTDDGAQRQKSPGKWNETDLDVSYDRKPHHSYDKTEWIRTVVPNSSWRESNLDGPPPPPGPKKTPPHHSSSASLPRNARISVPPDLMGPPHSPYYSQPIVSRISMPPASAQPHQRKPIPLSVIMRLQNPHWGAMATRHPRVLGGDRDVPPYQPPMPREFFHQPAFPPQQPPPELRQPAVYSDALNPADIDAELERLESVQPLPAAPGGGGALPAVPRPLSPTRLQPVVAPESQSPHIPDLEELLRIRAEIPRPLKRRGSVDQGRPLKKASLYQPNQYKTLIDKLFRRKERAARGEHGGGESSSSSEGEDAAMPPPQMSTVNQQDAKNYHSILRRPKKDRKSSGRQARLSPLVLLLDGALVGELDTVQKAVQEMTDPSQANDEGITGLHNAICGGHYNVVDFLVRIGANVSAPDSHGWTPLHCAASCNDRVLCEFLVRNGAAVVAMTESDGATAAQKCDPYAPGFEECESFLRGIEEAMGVENSGVLYALWTYPAQAADELSFREGDMVTILQKPDGSDWWWASLCGREGLVPSNYFGLFPKVRPKSLC